MRFSFLLLVVVMLWTACSISNKPEDTTGERNLVAQFEGISIYDPGDGSGGLVASFAMFVSERQLMADGVERVKLLTWPEALSAFDDDDVVITVEVTRKVSEQDLDRDHLVSLYPERAEFRRALLGLDGYNGSYVPLDDPGVIKDQCMCTCCQRISEHDCKCTWSCLKKCF